MKFAIVSGLAKPTTKEAKGGLEVWTANFIIEEAKRNKIIDLYAIKGSFENNNIKLIELLEKPLPDLYTESYFANTDVRAESKKAQFVATVYTRALQAIKENENSYDFVIDSCSYPSFTFNTSFVKKPVLLIGHFPVDFTLQFYLHRFGYNKNTYFIFPSSYQFYKANFIRDDQKYVIPHGITCQEFTFSDIGDKHMVWLSRIHEKVNKGVIQAIDVANKLNRIIKMYGFVEESSQAYFEDKVKPLLTSFVEFHRLTLEDTINKSEIFGKSKLFLFPLQWDEPFGLVLLESMATGTPVVAFARGAIQEIIKDGQTGFIVNSSDDDIRGDWIVKKTGIEGLCEAVERIYSLPQEQYAQMRKACREHVEKHFTVERMVNEYEKVYQKILQT